MTRFLLLAVLALVVFLVLRAALRNFLAGLGGTRPGAGRSALRDDLVKDPVCETYVPRRKAISRATPAGPRYFCSAACADKFAARS